MNRHKLKELLDTENEQLQKLNAIVIKSIDEEKLITEKLYEFEESHPSFTSQVADKITSFGGSWTFIFAFLLFMIIWIATNVYLLSRPFDPFPFIFLNLLLSTIAALQAPIIMMSQKRIDEKDRQRAVNDYLVNLKSEIEVRNLHQKLDLLISEQMKTLFELQKMQVELMEEIKSGLPGENEEKEID